MGTDILRDMLVRIKVRNSQSLLYRDLGITGEKVGLVRGIAATELLQQSPNALHKRKLFLEATVKRSNE